MTPLNFIAKILPSAQDCRSSPVSVTIAQAAVESSWGSSELCVKGNALFGIKADSNWHGDSIMLPTDEDLPDGRHETITALFRAYASWDESFSDHETFLKSNPRYAPALIHKDAENFVNAIAAAGYSTNPHYASLLMSIINYHNLTRFDHG